MTRSPGSIRPNWVGGPSRVIQGYFPGGKPRVLQASPAPVAQVRPPTPVPILPGRSATGALQPARPGQPPRPILPANSLQPRTLHPATPVRPQVPQPILPHRATTWTVQPSAGHAFALPANFALKPRGSGRPLPEPIQKKMESFFNTSFADVRVHIGHEASAIGALAFTHGTDLYFAPGQYNPQTVHGQQLLGHELTHVVQQRAGRVRNPLGAGLAVVQAPALEAEAERTGRRAASHQAAPLERTPAVTAQTSARRVSPFTFSKGVQRATLGVVQRCPARTELDYLVDDNFLPVALTDKPTAMVLKRKGVTVETWEEDNIFYEEEGTIHPLPASMINDYWNLKYPSPWVRKSDPDWRMNCADYAIGRHFDEVTDAKSFLARERESKGEYHSSGDVSAILANLPEGVYVAEVGPANSHFIKITIRTSDVLLSQKDQESGVYEATGTKEWAADYIFSKHSGGGKIYSHA